MEGKICNIIRDVLPLYIDDVVCQDTRDWMEAHLERCPDCAKWADEMRARPVMPANAEIRVRSVDGMKKFRRFLNNRRLITAIFVALGSLAAVVGAMCWLLCTVDVIEYDGSNIEIIETEDGHGLILCYRGRGDVLWSAGTVPETGETTLTLTQRLWDRYIDPIYDDTAPEYYLMDTDRTLIVKMSDTGEVLWEADAQQAERFYERQAIYYDEMNDEQTDTGE